MVADKMGQPYTAFFPCTNSGPQSGTLQGRSRAKDGAVVSLCLAALRLWARGRSSNACPEVSRRAQGEREGNDRSGTTRALTVRSSHR